MIGPILLAISWLLLRFEGRGLDVLGVDAPRRRAREFVVGFLAFGGVAALQQLGLSWSAGEPFVPNPALQPSMLTGQARFTINSVLFEELIFRGYLLYRAIRWLGARRAVWLSAAAFGVYHWFSYGVFGNPVAMVYVLLLTGMVGLLWARAFVATGSLAAPIGLHLGWNAVSYLIFSAGPLGAGLFVPASGARSIDAPGPLASLLLNLLLPAVATILGLWWLRRLEQRRTSPAAWHPGERPGEDPAERHVAPMPRD